MTELEFRCARTLDLDVVHLYRLLRLRMDVFVVEQQSRHPELDGRDLEPGARQLWYERDGRVVSTLRLLRDSDGTPRISRMCTARSERGTETPALLLGRALDMVGDTACILEAEVDMEAWYRQFGFVRDGIAYPDAYPDGGVAHVQMRRPAPRVAAVS